MDHRKKTSGRTTTRFLQCLRCRVTTLTLLLTVVLAGCTEPQTTGDWILEGEHGMVASDSAAASRIGAAVLRAGGNAVDAATAISFALAVTRPQSTGLGGGGFLIYRSAEDGRVFTLDFRECAPAAAHPQMFARHSAGSGAEVPLPSRYGFRAAAVPGLVAGRLEAHQRWGTKPLSELLQGAIMLARDGFIADEAYVKACHDAVEIYRAHPQLAASCDYVWRSHLRQGRPPKVGALVRTPALAALLDRIASEGRKGFYGGRVAAGIEAAMAANDGLITKDDLFRYEVKEREPLRIDYRGYEIIAMPLPSSGGICLAEILNILAEFDVGRIAQANPLDVWHLKAEAFKHAFADRANWLGDSDFVRVPTAWLTSREYGGSLAARVSLDLTSEVDGYGLAPPPEDHGTSHFCVVDSHGNCLVSTETINTGFGSLAAVGDWGLILNNEMDDFEAEPGRPNAYGLIHSRRNAILPGKRPLSSMAPTLVLKDRQPVLLIGASGG
ncbi:MAG: gamma-glutamyltransferase, partial [Phycisphaerales bacterium]